MEMLLAQLMENSVVTSLQEREKRLGSIGRDDHVAIRGLSGVLPLVVLSAMMAPGKLPLNVQVQMRLVSKQRRISIGVAEQLLAKRFCAHGVNRRRMCPPAAFNEHEGRFFFDVPRPGLLVPL